MRKLLRVSATLLAVSSLALILNLFDVITMTDGLHRTCGVVCLVSLFLTVYTRVWLISYRRKPAKRP